MTEQTIVAVYDTPAHAELAVQDLLKANVPEDAIHRHAQEGSYVGSAVTPTARASEGQGFWASLFGGETDHDTAYDRTVQSGSNAVSVKVPDEHVTRVSDILERHNPVDMDERAAGYGVTQTTTTTKTPVAGASPAVGLVGSAPTTVTGTTSATDGGTIQLSEERLSVGKRLINQGGTRIRRFVVEKPVEEQVTLHDEKVTLERHPVTDGRPVTNADFTDKTIEMTESREEVVVAKQAFVTEEIALKKQATDRVETVRDTVRREDVEIEQIPAEKVSATTTTTPVAPARTAKI